MKYQTLLSTLVGISLATALGVTAAQTTPATRGQVKMEREEFLKTHRYDAGMMDWVVKPGVEAPAGVMTRDEIIAARDKFLAMHRYNAGTQDWVKLPGPRDMSTLTREQVKKETAAFSKTMVFNNETATWSKR